MTKPVSKLSRAELQRLIRTLSATSERIVWTLYADRQMKRRKITKQIALEVLQHGSIRLTPEPNPAKGSIECRMERYVAGIECTVVAALHAELVGTDPELIVIVATAWDQALFARKDLKMYHYTDGGLRNVWLANGYKMVKTPYGKGVTIEDIAGLAKTIAGVLCQKPSRLTGAEFRFVRQAMCLSQRSLGDMLGCTEQTIALWEKTKVKLPKMADTLVRAIFLGQEHPDTLLGPAIARLQEVDRIVHQRIVASEGSSGWQARVEQVEMTGEAAAA